MSFAKPPLELVMGRQGVYAILWLTRILLAFVLSIDAMLLINVVGRYASGGALSVQGWITHIVFLGWSPDQMDDTRRAITALHHAYWELIFLILLTWFLVEMHRLISRQAGH